MELNNVYDLFNIDYRYDFDPNAPEAPTNQQASKTNLPVFICPSSPRGTDVDIQGYGFTDYSAPVTVRPGLNGNSSQPRFKCALNGDTGHRLSQVRDGLSNTIAIAEDAGRADVPSGGFMVIKTENMDDGTPADRRSWAWADPEMQTKQREKERLRYPLIKERLTDTP